MGFDRIIFLTMDREKYEKTVGRIFKRELHKAIEFIQKFPFAADLKKHELILLAASTER
jgi:hypothetical protein